MKVQLSRKQQALAALCDDAHHARIHDHLLLRVITEVKPQVDLRRLKRAIEKLAARHDTLRLRFLKSADHITGEILEKLETALDVIETDLTDKDALEAEALRLSEQPIPVIDHQLFETKILVAQDRSYLICKIHHAIADGFSIVLLTEELISLLIGLPVTKPALSHEDYIRQWSELPKSIMRKNDRFWEEKLLPISEGPNIGRISKGLAVARPTENVTYLRVSQSYSEQQLTGIQSWMSKNKVSPSAVTSTVLARAFRKLGGSEELIVTHGIPRTQAKLSCYAGDHTLNGLLKCSALESVSVLDDAKRLTADLLEIPEHLPSDTIEPGGRVHTAMRDHGYVDSGFFVIVPRAFGRQKNSQLIEASDTEEPVWKRLGKYQIKTWPVVSTSPSLSEFRINISFQGPKGQLEFIADQKGFTEEELSLVLTEFNTFFETL